MRANKSAGKRKPGERVYLEPKPRLRLLKLRPGCSTPELASEPTEGLKAALLRG